MAKPLLFCRANGNVTETVTLPSFAERNKRKEFLWIGKSEKSLQNYFELWRGNVYNKKDRYCLFFVEV